VLASSSTPAYFAEEHLDFLETVARWVGLVAERAELSQRLAEEAAARERRTAAEELIAVLAHDLRNHLSTLRGRLDLLKRRAQSDSQPDYVDGAQAAITAVDRLGKLVNDLLDSERLERGLFTLRPEAVDLVALAKETAGSFRAEGVRLVVRAPDELWLPADPERLRQCLDNLVSNALTHSPGGGQVTIEVAHARRGALDGARLSIQDEGPGVPSQLVPRLFERFARGTRSGGLGLGLFLASRIAVAHAGTLTLDSPPGSPARFSLWLPTSAPG
jgi:signal transduction histidine kinase